MGQAYDHLTLEERCELARRRQAGETIRQIAAALGRAPSSLSRELKRNGAPKAAYKPVLASDLGKARRWRGSRLARDEILQGQVLEHLALGWSPEQVAGRLKRERGQAVISHESIYRFIYAQMRRTNDGSWRKYLPRAKFKRGRRARKGGSPALHIKDRISVHQRPDQAQDRQQAGHWEGDFMLFSKYGHNALVLHERTSRLTVVTAPPNRLAEPTAQSLGDLLEPLPADLRLSLTFDNGTEFAAHWRLNERLGLETYFCDPHSPWQKGGVENAIGRLRRFLPRKANLDTLDLDDILWLNRFYNHTPRKCLDFQTPAEVFALLHLKCESTSRLSSG
jgi:IS30 family transposase